QVDGRPQVTHRAVEVLQVGGGDPGGALGDRLGGEIALGARLPHDRGGEVDRASRVGLCEPQNLADPSGRAHPSSLARINRGVDVSGPGRPPPVGENSTAEGTGPCRTTGKRSKSRLVMMRSSSTWTTWPGSRTC